MNRRSIGIAVLAFAAIAAGHVGRATQQNGLALIVQGVLLVAVFALALRQPG